MPLLNYVIISLIEDPISVSNTQFNFLVYSVGRIGGFARLPIGMIPRRYYELDLPTSPRLRFSDFTFLVVTTQDIECNCHDSYFSYSLLHYITLLITLLSFSFTFITLL